MTERERETEWKGPSVWGSFHFHTSCLSFIMLSRLSSTKLYVFEVSWKNLQQHYHNRPLFYPRYLIVISLWLPYLEDSEECGCTHVYDIATGPFADWNRWSTMVSEMIHVMLCWCNSLNFSLNFNLMMTWVASIFSHFSYIQIFCKLGNLRHRWLLFYGFPLTKSIASHYQSDNF